MSAQHTPGPWTTGRVSWDRSGEVRYTLHGIKAAHAADARLIAAAPDLLEALKICLDAERQRRRDLTPNAPATTYCERRIAMIEAAIAKAEGTT